MVSLAISASPSSFCRQGQESRTEDGDFVAFLGMLESLALHIQPDRSSLQVNAAHHGIRRQAVGSDFGGWNHIILSKHRFHQIPGNAHALDSHVSSESAGVGASMALTCLARA